MTNGKRDWKKQKKWEKAHPAEEKKKDERTILRNKMVKEGKVKRHDGKDVDHIKPLSKGGKNTESNARVESVHANRSFHRNRDSSLHENKAYPRKKK